MEDEESIQVAAEDSIIGDHEIPAEYIENPPPESLNMLDDQIAKVNTGN